MEEAMLRPCVGRPSTDQERKQALSYCNNDAVTRRHQLLICELKEHHEGLCRSGKWTWGEAPNGQISAIAWKDKDHPDWKARALAAEASLDAALPTVIETADKLRSLPNLSAILAPNRLVAQRRPDGLWWAAGGTRGITDASIIALCPTVTVLHRGDEQPPRAEKETA
jgi:hypothetical protein